MKKKFLLAALAAIVATFPCLFAACSFADMRAKNDVYGSPEPTAPRAWRPAQNERAMSEDNGETPPTWEGRVRERIIVIPLPERHWKFDFLHREGKKREPKDGVHSEEESAENGEDGVSQR